MPQHFWATLCQEELLWEPHRQGCERQQRFLPQWAENFVFSGKRAKDRLSAPPVPLPQVQRPVREARSQDSSPVPTWSSTFHCQEEKRQARDTCPLQKEIGD